MKKIIYFLILLTFLFGAVSTLAQDSNLPSPGILPDSPFYFLKAWKEAIQNFFTFGVENKAKQFLHLADVRLAEYQKMIEKEKTEIAQKTLDKYEKQLNHALQKIEELKNKGEDTKVISQKVEDSLNKHIEILQRNLQKVPEAAKKGIENAIKNSSKVIEKAGPILIKEFSYPYPLSWREDGINFNLTGVSLGQTSAPSRLKNSSGGYYKQGENVYALTLILKIKIPKTYTSCVLMNFRREINEEGDMASPDNEQFYFPDTGGCMPEEDVTYTDQRVIFIVPESEKLFTFTTGGQSNIFFTVQIIEDGELKFKKTY